MNVNPGDRICQLYHSDGVPFWVKGYEVAEVSPYSVYIRRPSERRSKPLRLDKSLVAPESLIVFPFDFQAVYGIPYVCRNGVEVLNLRGDRRLADRPEVTYIGRKCSGLPESPLHNPFKMAHEGQRNCVCDSFVAKVLRPALVKQSCAVWEAFIELVYQFIRSGCLKLACWCAPSRCHGHAIAHFVERYAYSLSHYGGCDERSAAVG
ncbi:MAG: DUF4326 domain-containing protein [Cyanobacteria bacterium J06639_14]